MLMGPQNLPEKIRAVRDRIGSATARCGRDVDSVTLLAVGKAHPAETLAAAAACGLRHFGESYVKEALPKIETLRELALTWHFVGQLQANKTRPVAEHFDWAHGVDRLRIAERLSEQRPFHAAPLNVCLQVNLAGEGTKGGVAPADLPALATAVAALPRLSLRGLMCIPPPEDDETRQRQWFAETARLLRSLSVPGAPLDTLSMGMSADLEAAIEEGATIVRIGTALFGPRP
ncbi:MAG TPA: YggS family pyridoxal phosphate-dependent enzyme [Steroidobacteraceae bacterium]|nr:YggS family pyridoxal phosphate-dependent enzyme [Steroidobacteraceae bacterium]